MPNKIIHNIRPEYLQLVNTFMYDPENRTTASESERHSWIIMSDELFRALQFIQTIDQMDEFMKFRYRHR